MTGVIAGDGNDGPARPATGGVADTGDPELAALIADIRREVALRRASDAASGTLATPMPGAEASPGVLGRMRARAGRWLRTVASHPALRPAMRYVRGGRRIIRVLPRLARIDELLAATRDVVAYEQAQRLENFSRQAQAEQTELRAEIAELRRRLEALEARDASAGAVSAGSNGPPA